MTSVKGIFAPSKPIQSTPLKQSPGIADDFAVRKVVNTQEGTIQKTPSNDYDIANKKYVDDTVTGEGVNGFAASGSTLMTGNVYLSGSTGITLAQASNCVTITNSTSHTRAHALDSTSDHSLGSLTAGKIVMVSGSVLLNAANTDTQVAAAVTATHTSGADTALASGATMTGYCYAADHGAAATDMLVNVCYGTGAAPTASDTTEGTLYVTYTA